tara:strand:+ start:990 stop:1439 length:450 start_codon:yes stop_codon:yes gene_type:complete
VSLFITFDEGFSLKPSLIKKLENLISIIFSDEKIINSSVNLRILSDVEMRKLNHQFRNKDKTTNVLSFTNEDISIDKTKNIGDIAISYDFVMNESKDQGKKFEDHMIHMLVHGVYHILGHDHENDLMADIMESKEIEVLDKLNIKNPYY